MNNELILRTDKGEYHPGDTIFGAVYLHICRPTEGCGVQVTFTGSEQCEYKYEGKKSVSKETAQLDFSDITLYSQDDCFQFGAYVFPFSFLLPNEIAGTTALSGENDCNSWKVKVSYWIKAWVKGSDNINQTLPIVIYQCDSVQLQESSAGLAETSTFEVKRFGFGNKQVNVTVKLVECFQTSGLNNQLRLIITNDTKVVVTGFDVKLKRVVKLIFKRTDCDPETKTSLMTIVDDKIEILPEAGPHLIKAISGSGNSFLTAALDNLQVPLVEKTKSGETIDLPPSAVGKCFKIRYGLEVCVTFSNKQMETLSLVLPGVLPRRNVQWLSWKAPDWVFHCEIKLSNCLFSVAERLLHTEAFSTLPGFQVL